MAPHSSTLAWKIPWTEEPGGCRPWDREESDMTERLHFHFSLSYIGEGNGNLLQCSCLENPRDGGAWWAAIYGVAQSQTRLKRLSSSSSIECSTFTASSSRIWNSSTGIPTPPITLFIVMLSKAHLTSYSRMSGSWCSKPSKHESKENVWLWL